MMMMIKKCNMKISTGASLLFAVILIISISSNHHLFHANASSLVNFISDSNAATPESAINGINYDQQQQNANSKNTLENHQTNQPDKYHEHDHINPSTFSHDPNHESSNQHHQESATLAIAEHQATGAEHFQQQQQQHQDQQQHNQHDQAYNLNQHNGDWSMADLTRSPPVSGAGSDSIPGNHFGGQFPTVSPQQLQRRPLSEFITDTFSLDPQKNQKLKAEGDQQKMAPNESTANDHHHHQQPQPTQTKPPPQVQQTNNPTTLNIQQTPSQAPPTTAMSPPKSSSSFQFIPSSELINMVPPYKPRASTPSVQIQQQPQSQPQQHMEQSQQQQQQQQQPPPQLPSITLTRAQQVPLPVGFQQPLPNGYHHHHPMSPLYFGHNPFIEKLRPLSYADDNIVTLNLSHSHIYEIDSDAFVGQRFEHIDLSNNKLGLIHSKSFRIGPAHSKHNPQFNPHHNTLTASGSSANNNGTSPTGQKGPNTLQFAPRRPPPSNPKSVTIDFSHNPAIVALSGAFDHIDVPNCLLNFTNSTVELKFGAFKKYFKEHPGHIVEIDSVDCCEQEWLLGYKHNFVPRTHCEHDPSLLLTKAPQQTIIDSCITYVTSARHSMTIQGPSIIHQVAAAPRHHSSSHQDNQYLTYLILGGTAMILTSLSIYIIFYMFSLKAAFVYQMQHKS